MSAKVISNLWKQVRDARRRVKADDDRLVILLALAGFADDDARCIASIDTLSKITDLSHVDVRGHLDELEQLGHIRRQGPNATVIEIVLGQEQPEGAQR